MCGAIGLSKSAVGWLDVLEFELRIPLRGELFDRGRAALEAGGWGGALGDLAVVGMERSGDRSIARETAP